MLDGIFVLWIDNYSKKLARQMPRFSDPAFHLMLWTAYGIFHPMQNDDIKAENQRLLTPAFRSTGLPADLFVDYAVTAIQNGYARQESLGLNKFDKNPVLLHQRVPLEFQPAAYSAATRPFTQTTKPTFAPWMLKDMNIGSNEGLVRCLRFLCDLNKRDDDKDDGPFMIVADENVIVRYLRVSESWCQILLCSSTYANC